jgi:hypothetical protein
MPPLAVGSGCSEKLSAALESGACHSVPAGRTLRPRVMHAWSSALFQASSTTGSQRSWYVLLACSSSVCRAREGEDAVCGQVGAGGDELHVAAGVGQEDDQEARHGRLVSHYILMTPRPTWSMSADPVEPLGQPRPTSADIDQVGRGAIKM